MHAVRLADAHDDQRSGTTRDVSWSESLVVGGDGSQSDAVGITELCDLLSAGFGGVGTDSACIGHTLREPGRRRQHSPSRRLDL